MLQSHLLYVKKDEKVLDNKAEKCRNILKISQKHTFYQPKKTKKWPIIRRHFRNWYSTPRGCVLGIASKFLPPPPKDDFHSNRALLSATFLSF